MKPGSDVSQETLSHLTVYTMFHAVYSTRSVNFITDTVERLCPKTGATEATFTEVLRAEWSFFRTIWDALYVTTVLAAQPGPSKAQELAIDVVDFTDRSRYVAQDATQLDVTKNLYTSNVVKHAKLEVASYVQQIAEDVTRQRALERPESFLAEVEVLVPYKRKVLYYHPSLPTRDLALLAETYPGIEFQPATGMMVCNDHELAAIARRAATHNIYTQMYAYAKVETLDRSDIGGNQELSFNHDTRVHYCRMTMDVRDGARNTRRAIALQSADVMRPGLAKK